MGHHWFTGQGGPPDLWFYLASHAAIDSSLSPSTLAFTQKTAPQRDYPSPTAACPLLLRRRHSLRQKQFLGENIRPALAQVFTIQTILSSTLILDWSTGRNHRRLTLRKFLLSLKSPRSPPFLAHRTTTPGIQAPRESSNNLPVILSQERRLRSQL